MGLFSSDVESIEIKFDQVQQNPYYIQFLLSYCKMFKDGKPFLAGDEVTGTITAKFKKDVKVRYKRKTHLQNYNLSYQYRSILSGFLLLSQLQLDLTLEQQKEM